MLRVDAIFNVPHMSLNYKQAFADFEKFAKANAKSDISKVYISLRDVDNLSHPYLFGMMENITANPDVEFVVKQHSGDSLLASITKTLLTLDNVSLLGDGVVAYVAEEPVHIPKNK